MPAGDDGIGVDCLPNDGRPDSLLANPPVVDGHLLSVVHEAAVLLNIQEIDQDLLRPGDSAGRF